MGNRFFENIAGVSARKTFIRCDDKEKLLAARMRFEQRMLEISNISRYALDHFGHLVRIRFIGYRSHLRTTQTCSGNHLHCFGDLLDAFYAFDSPAYVL